jgi:CO/xanthine dehydrogenase FAD-binding subunit
VTLPAFDLLRPATLPEALEMLSATPNALPVAGGTNLIPDLRKGTHAPSTLVDISGLPELCCIRHKDGHVLIGGGVTIAELLDDPMIVQDAPVLGEMARSFANALIRNRATIGGNLVNAAPCCDSAPALLALDAEVELSSAVGTRRLRLAEFLVDAFTTERRPNELLTCVRVPIPSERSYGGFAKMGLRKISCMAKIDVAVQVTVNGEMQCTSARIALGAVAPSALRAEEAEATLAGQVLIASAPAARAHGREQKRNRLIELAGRLAGEAAVPRSGSEYKRQIVEALTKRLLADVAARIEGTS